MIASQSRGRSSFGPAALTEAILTGANAACVERLTKRSPQLRVLGLGLLKDGDVGVSVFQEREEILALEGPGAAPQLGSTIRQQTTEVLR
jgi:hypothetical protein